MARACRPRARAAESGLSLVEVLVALSLMLVALTGALSLYDATWDSFKQGENAAAQQQGLRIALDKITLDVQMAGLNLNPDGDEDRRDEPIEAAYDSAIVVRGDYDGEPPEDCDPGVFDVMSTGNDEIVAYVLANGSSSDVLEFRADFDCPRDGIHEDVDVSAVALDHADPPYTLYRVTFGASEDVTVREVLAEGIGAMGFRYFDVAGEEITDDLGPGCTRDDRARIHLIEIDLLALALDPNADWLDPADPDPVTRRFHKFRLKSKIRPRNLGTVGSGDLDT